MEYEEDDYLLLSGIQHYVFCKRQWALIHIDIRWREIFFIKERMIRFLMRNEGDC